MTFIITDAQRLISEAGGDAPIGTKLKTYFLRLCEDLHQYVGHRAQIRSIERAWREGTLSQRLREALEKLARQRAYDADIQLVLDFESMLEAIESAPTSTKRQHMVAAQIRPSLSAIKQCVAQRYRNAAVARCFALIEASEREAAEESCQ